MSSVDTFSATAYSHAAAPHDHRFSMKILVLLTALTLTSCFHKTYKVADFTGEELLWFKPFTKTDTVVFISAKGELDSVIFKAAESSHDAVRNFEQGFYNTNYLTVNYDFTRGSHHQFAMMSDGKTRYDQDFMNAAKSSNGYSSLEIGFIGTLFSENIKNIRKINDSTYFFDSEKADCSGVNVEKGIRGFTFNTRLGVMGFEDDRGVRWVRH